MTRRAVRAPGGRKPSCPEGTTGGRGRERGRRGQVLFDAFGEPGFDLPQALLRGLKRLGFQTNTLLLGTYVSRRPIYLATLFESCLQWIQGFFNLADGRALSRCGTITGQCAVRGHEEGTCDVAHVDIQNKLRTRERPSDDHSPTNTAKGCGPSPGFPRSVPGDWNPGDGPPMSRLSRRMPRATPVATAGSSHLA